MLRKTLFLMVFGLTLVFSAALVHAQSDQEIAAANFLKFLQSGKEILSVQRLEANDLAPSEAKVFMGYLINLKGGGYILVSASTSLTPVKAYSLSGSFDSLPEPYKLYLLTELEYNIRMLAAGTVLQPTAISENQQRWGFLLNFGTAITPFSYTPNTVLLTTKWDQGPPYNKFLPDINGINVQSGCVNIAVGQLLKYYNYPAKGNGFGSYTWNSQQLKTVLFRDYNWANMPDVLDGTTPGYKTDEVALLIRDLGIVNHTNFGLNNSGAAIDATALVENFGLSSAVQKMDNTNVTNFADTLKAEIDATRPVLLALPGHMVVADGYNSDVTGQNIHLNMGWGGDANDYYYIDYVPGSHESISAGNYIFPLSPLTIYYNLKPCSGNDCAPNLEPGDAVNGFSVAGKFNFTYDGDMYNVYLKGATTLSGSRGYDNQGFYLSIYDSNSVMVDEKDSALSDNLPAGLYTVRASLCSSGGYCYDWEDNSFANYTATMTSQPLTDEEKAAIDASLNVGPVIYSTLNDVVLNSTNPQAFSILVDARDQNGDAVTVSVANSNNDAVQATMAKNVLSLTPVAGASKIASKVTVTATANGKTATKSFVVMLLNEDIGFGKKFVVNGLFESPSDFNTHKAILDGFCTISGFNGYSNQAFYTSVKNASGNTVVTPRASQISGTFGASIYSIGASLQSGSGSYFDYQQGQGDTYSITVSCPSANDDTTTIATLLGIDLSGTEGPKPQPSGLTLNGGWNFVSFPKLPSPTAAIEAVLSDVSPSIRIVWGYDNQNKQWLKYFPSAMSHELAAIEPGKGYWIYMDASANLTLTGTDVSPNVQLYAGWNLVGYNGTDGTGIVTALNALSGNWKIMWGWANGQWSVKAASDGILVVPELATLNKGKAYWIKLNSATPWQQ